MTSPVSIGHFYVYILELTSTQHNIYKTSQPVRTKLSMEFESDHFYFWFMVLNATFNNISVILWQSVLLVEGTGVL